MDTRSAMDIYPLSRLQIWIVGMCFVLNMLDGMDVLAISFAAPIIARDWTISPQELGIVFSAALAGMAIGAVGISPFSDVIGRRRIILLSLVIIGVGMLATAYAQSVAQLVILRLVAGLGIGSILASLTSLVSEYSPEKYRNFNILFYSAGYPVGAMLMGFVAAWMLPAFGWRTLFFFAGCVSLSAIPLVYFLVPESIEFLLKKQPRGSLELCNDILRKMGRPLLDRLPEREAAHDQGVGVGALLSDERRTDTLMLWLVFMMSFATLYFLFSWVVKLAVDSGLDIKDAIYAGVSMNLGAFCGSITVGFLSLKVGLKKVLAAYFFIAAVVIIPYGFVRTSVAFVLILIFILMYFTQGAFTGLYAVAAKLYPTEIRTTGVGWAIGAGRAGAIFGPAVAGFILGAGVSIGWTFVIFSAPMFVAALIMSRLQAPD